MAFDEEILRRRVSRRSFLGGGLALVGTGVIAACGGDGGGTAAPPAEPPPAEPPAEPPPAEPPAEPPPAATTEAPAETTAPPETGPARGGVLVFSDSEQPRGLDPTKWWDGPNGTASYAIFDRLVETNDQGELVPGLLAELPEINADGTLYTFRLRPGVLFHHGRELTADDVKFTFERLVSPAYGSEGGSLYTGFTIPGMEDVLSERANELEGIKVVDPQTLTVELEQPDSAFLYVLSFAFGSIVPRDAVEELGDEAFNTAPVGTGPFKVASADLATGITLERHTEYFQPDLPYLDGVDWQVGVDPELAALRIQADEQDLMFEGLPKAVLDQVRDSPDFADRLITGVANNVYYLTLSLKHPALKELKVRQAIAHAIDKERFIRTIGGLGQPADGGLFSPQSPYYQAGIGYPYDPEQAKQLLAEAGYADGFDVKFWGRNFSPYLDLGQTAQQDLKQIGINMELIQQDNNANLTIIVTNPEGLTENEWELPYPHGSYVMDGAFTTAALDAGCCNFSNFRSEDFDSLAAQAHRSTDPAEVAELYKQMDRIAIQEQALWVPVAYPGFASLVSSRLKGYTVPKLGNPLVKYFRNYWIEA
jgi:ABC-type transport system substrate-binding protein